MYRDRKCAGSLLMTCSMFYCLCFMSQTSLNLRREARVLLQEAVVIARGGVEGGAAGLEAAGAVFASDAVEGGADRFLPAFMRRLEGQLVLVRNEIARADADQAD